MIIKKIIFIFTLNFIIIFNNSPYNVAQEKIKTYKLQSEDYLNAPANSDAKIFIVVPFDIDKEGNLFIFDRGKKRVLKFSYDGNFIQSIGRKGDGPGEFTDGSFISFSRDGLIYSSKFMGSRIEVLDNNGKYIREINYSKKNYSIGNFSVVNKDNIFANLLDQSMISGKGLQTKEYNAIINLNNLSNKIIGDIIEKKPFDFNQYYIGIAIDSRENFYLGLNSKKEYKVFLYDNNGNLLKIITKNFEPIEITGERRKEFEKVIENRKMILKTKFNTEVKADDSPYYYIIDWLAIDSYDNLWIFTCEGKNKNMFSIDLYDKNGNYKKTFYLDNYELATQYSTRVKIFKNYLYAHINGKDGYEHIYRYKLPKEIWE